MNFAKILEIAKKNLFSISCAVVAIAAIAATFWPLGGMITQLQETADKRASIYSALDGLYNQSRKLPLTDPTKTTQDDLTQFPNEKTLEEGERVTKDVSAQSQKMVAFVVDLNARPHKPLVDQVLPNAVSSTAMYRFGDIYKLALSIDADESMTTDPKLKEAKQPNLRNDILQAGIPPTDLDIQAAQKDLLDNTYSPRIVYQNGVAKNQQQIMADYAAASAKLPDQMKTEVATKKKVYMAPDAFTINPTVTGAQQPLPVDVWFSQLTLWVQQDVAEAIREANANSKNILDAPVKHLVKLTIPMTPSPYVGLDVTAPGAAAAAPPTPFEGGDTQPLKKNLTVSATGRVSNPMYDVVQFTLVVKVDASQIPAFIQTLGQNRLIDVYNVNQVSIDSIDARQAGYIYGSMPVVQLTLNCEALFMRQWTVPLMPKAVLTLLNLAPPAAPQAVVQ